LLDTFGKCEFESIVAALLTECGRAGNWRGALPRARLHEELHRVDQMIERGWLVSVNGAALFRLTPAAIHRLRQRKKI